MTDDKESQSSVRRVEAGLLATARRCESAAGGTLCVAAHHFSTGAEFFYRGDHRCRSASVIKLPILVHAALAVAEGTLDWNRPLRLTEAEKVGGSGVLSNLTEGLMLSLHDACTLMTVVSDNTATNMIIELIGVEPINERMRSLGLPLTQLFRKSYAPDTDASLPYGLGATTPREMLGLLAALSEGRLGSLTATEEILGILARQTDRAGIPRMLPATWTYAGKTGAIDSVRNDVGIVTAPDGSKAAFAIFANHLPSRDWTPDNPGLLAIAEMAKAIAVCWMGF